MNGWRFAVLLGMALGLTVAAPADEKTPPQTPVKSAPAKKASAKKGATKKSPPAKTPMLSGRPGRLRIGWAERDISTDLPVLIPGGFSRPIAKGTADKLTVTSLAIDNGFDAVIFLSCDHVHIGGGEVAAIQRLVRVMDPKLPLDKWIVNSTHTHSGAAVFGPGRHGVPEGTPYDEKGEYRKMFLNSCAEAIAEAWRTRALGKVAWGYGFVTAGFSRRTIYSEDLTKLPAFKYDPNNPVMPGRGTMHGPNLPEFSHYEAGQDPFANYLFTFDMNDKLTGGIINISTTAQCGAVEPGRLSADFWNEARAAFRAKYGDHIHLLPQCAAAGDITPRQQHYHKALTRRLKLKYGDRAEPRVQCYRMDIADRVLASFDEVLSWASKDKRYMLVLCHSVIRPKLARATYAPDDVAAAQRCLDELEKLPPPDEVDPAARLKTLTYRATQRAKYQKVVRTAESVKKLPALETEFHIVRLGDIAFASNPFELFIDYMHRIQRQSPYELTFIVQLAQMAGSAAGYLPTERAVANRGYSAEPYSYSISPAGGATLVTETVKELRRLYVIRWRPPAPKKSAPARK
jgi:hypothetical protein